MVASCEEVDVDVLRSYVRMHFRRSAPHAMGSSVSSRCAHLATAYSNLAIHNGPGCLYYECVSYFTVLRENSGCFYKAMPKQTKRQYSKA